LVPPGIPAPCYSPSGRACSGAFASLTAASRTSIAPSFRPHILFGVQMWVDVQGVYASTPVNTQDHRPVSNACAPLQSACTRRRRLSSTCAQSAPSSWSASVSLRTKWTSWSSVATKPRRQQLRASWHCPRVRPQPSAQRLGSAPKSGRLFASAWGLPPSHTPLLPIPTSA
jgi:hypothetical protein